MNSGENQMKGTEEFGSISQSLIPVSVAGSGLYIGGLINNRYLIEKELGRGGVGVVFLGRDQQLLSRPVVIKVLLEESAKNQWFKKKFRQEMEALSRINHPGVIGVLDAGEMLDGKPYLVMQFVEGTDLRAAMTAEGMNFQRAANILRQIGQALSMAHEKGVYHRDLKPENIMLENLDEDQEQVKLIDFGIARVVDSKVASDRETTAVAGTISYMAPEQLMGKPSATSDIYALGIIAYEMLCGRRPFNPESPYQLLEMQKAGVKVKPTDLRPGIAQAAEAAILKALSFDSKDRHLRARDLGDELAGALDRNESYYPVQAEPSAKTVIKAGAGVERAVEMPADQLSSVEIAHVLFMDIVGYSRHTMDEQRHLLNQLKDITCSTVEFRRAQAIDQLISLPTGDGMALVFLRDPIAHVKCAFEIARLLKGHPEIRLRIGLHSGPIYLMPDINGNRNVTGGGINMAQRVMDCGDADHILVSKTVADLLSQLGEWAEYVHDAGEREVKHGVRVHIFNLYAGELGNQKLPDIKKPVSKLRDRNGKSERRLKPAFIISAFVMTIIIAGLLVIYFTGRPSRTNTETRAELRQLDYSITLLRNARSNPGAKPIRLSRETLFSAGDRLRFDFFSPQTGWLYILNEGPATQAGAPELNIVFPLPRANQNSAEIAPNQPVQIPGNTWFEMDNEAGSEKLWLVWSASEVPELDKLKKWDNPKDQGEIKDVSEIKAAQSFLSAHNTSEVAVEKDDELVQTNLKANGNVLVYLITLAHRREESHTGAR
jgi:serine/threonine protein kinase